MTRFWLIIVAVLATIALGFITKINAGLFGLAFSFLIGTFFLGMSINSLLALWPVKIMFILIAVNLFYNFATLNGTVEKLAMSILWKFRKVHYLWPIGIALASFIVCVIGSGFFAVIAMLSPIAYVFAKKTRSNPLLGQIAVVYLASAGGQFFVTSTGAIVRGILINIGFEEVSITYTFYNLFACTIMAIVYLCIATFMSRKAKINPNQTSNTGDTALDITKPEPFDEKQRITLTLIFGMIVLLIIPYIMVILMPKNSIIIKFSQYMDVGFLAVIFSILAVFLKLGDEKSAIKMIPWNIIILISGISILISIASSMGVVDALTGMATVSGSRIMTAVLMTFIAGTMGIFSSTNGVVFPTLFPVVANIAMHTGLPAPFLFSCIIVGAISTGISPMSTAGGLSLGASPDDITSNHMYKSLWIFPVVGHISMLIIVGIVTAIFFN
jgi:di/tricarboxylate transporter